MLRQLGWDQAVAELAVVAWWSAVSGVGSVLLWRLLLDWGCWRLFAEDVLSWALALRWILAWRRHLGCVEVAVNELASLPVWAVAILHILLAQFGFVEYWNIGFCHHLLLSMGKWALITVFAITVLFEVFAHFGSEFVNVWGRRGESLFSCV